MYLLKCRNRIDLRKKKRFNRVEVESYKLIGTYIEGLK